MNKLKLLIIAGLLAACANDKECITGPTPQEIPGQEVMEISEEIETIIEPNIEGIPPEVVIESSGSGALTFQHFQEVGYEKV